MLSLQLKSGEYLTIGDDIAVQVFQTGPSFRVAVKAPREVPIVRGEVLERGGESRPDGLRTQKPQSPSRCVRNAKNLEAHLLKKEQESDAFRKIWNILDRMDGGSDVQELRNQLQRVAAAAECRV